MAKKYKSSGLTPTHHGGEAKAHKGWLSYYDSAVV